MRMLITELLAEVTCEFSGKTGECLKVVFDQNAPPAIVSTKKFIELVRFQAQQQAKRAAAASPATEGRAPAPRSLEGLPAGSIG